MPLTALWCPSALTRLAKRLASVSSARLRALSFNKTLSGKALVLFLVPQVPAISGRRWVMAVLEGIYCWIDIESRVLKGKARYIFMTSLLSGVKSRSLHVIDTIAVS